MNGHDKSGGEDTTREMRASVREIFLHALEESSVERGFNRRISYERGILQVGDDLYDLATFSRLFVVSFGKAAHSGLNSLVTRLGSGAGATGIVCAPTLPDAQVFGFRYFEGGHPLPNAESLRAAEAILRALEALNARALVIYLISGGGSPMVEKPISDEITFDDLIGTYQALSQSGADIAQINALRIHLSAVKGGRMAVAASPAHQLSILISDLPERATESLAGGPTVPDTSSVEQCYEIVQRYNLMPRLPHSVGELIRKRALEETPCPHDPAFARTRCRSILSNADALKAAVERAALAGFAIQIDNSCDDWDYRKAADFLLERLRELRKGVSRVCLISGGDVRVPVGATSDTSQGVGGRNQQFVLYCAGLIQEENIAVLSASTSGIDGNSPAAGAVADGSTMSRARVKGLSAEAALAAHNAYPFFDALGDTIITGSTGTDVRDVRVLLAW